MKKNKSQISPVGRLGILFSIIGIPVIFVLMSKGLDNLINVSPGVIVAIIVILSTLYSWQSSKLLYEFYDIKQPIWSIVPCIGELSLTTRVYNRIGLVLYFLAFICGVIALAPYSVIRVFGVNALQTIPFYMMLTSLILLFAIQVVKGIGISIVFKDIEESWYEIVHTRLGIIDKYKILLFVPFIRIIGLYGIRKPLETLIVFNKDSIGVEDVLEEDYN